MADHRDALTWVAIELTSHGENQLDEGTLEATLRRDLKSGPDHPIFIPAASYTRGNQNVTIHLMEGYVFVATGLGDVAYFRLEQLAYVERVLTQEGPRSLRYVSVIQDSHIDQMRYRLRTMVTAEIALGAFVLILDGNYRQLEGQVIGLEEEFAYIRISLRSLELVVTVPRMFLDICDR